MKIIKVIGIVLSGIIFISSAILLSGFADGLQPGRTPMVVLIILIMIYCFIGFILAYYFSIEKYKQQSEIDGMQCRYDDAIRMWNNATSELKGKLADEIVNQVVKNYRNTKS